LRIRRSFVLGLLATDTTSRVPPAFKLGIRYDVVYV
jgi:hypothetical protein